MTTRRLLSYFNYCDNLVLMHTYVSGTLLYRGKEMPILCIIHTVFFLINLSGKVLKDNLSSLIQNGTNNKVNKKVCKKTA